MAPHWILTKLTRCASSCANGVLSKQAIMVKSEAVFLLWLVAIQRGSCENASWPIPTPVAVEDAALDDMQGILNWAIGMQQNLLLTPSHHLKECAALTRHHDQCGRPPTKSFILSSSNQNQQRPQFCYWGLFYLWCCRKQRS